MIREQRDYFEKLYSEHGNSVESLGWNKESQKQRFDVLSKIGNFNGASILDVGCGFGDFLSYLKRRDILPYKYVGIDLISEFIARAAEMHPGTSFYNKDVLSFGNNDSSYGYVVGSGLFFLDTEDWYKYVLDVADKMFHLCNIGIGINFLSQYNIIRPVEGRAYCNPGSVLQMLMDHISIKAILYHDYRENDFTVFLYK